LTAVAIAPLTQIVTLSATATKAAAQLVRYVISYGSKRPLYCSVVMSVAYHVGYLFLSIDIHIGRPL